MVRRRLPRWAWHAERRALPRPTHCRVIRMAAEEGPLVREPVTGERRQEWGTIATNALRLDPAVAESIVAALRVDFAGSFNLLYLLRKHHWTAVGAEQGDVADFLEGAYRRVQDINDALAVRTVQLGGIPPTTPATIQAHASVHLEAEDLYDLRASLEGDLLGYADLLDGMRDHVGLATALGDHGTAERLHEHLETLEADAHEVEQYLESDTLVAQGSGD